jgi:tetratricopeptide (TPR) repeat protein
MMKDKFGLETSVNNSDAMDCLNTYFTQLTGFGSGAGIIIEAAEQFRDAVLIQVCAAQFNLYGQCSDAYKEGFKYIERCRRLKNSDITEREKIYLNITDAFYRNDFYEAVAIAENCLLNYPRDLHLLGLLQFFYLVAGQYFNAARFVNSCRVCEPYYENDADFLAFYSFACELHEDYDKAKMIADKGLLIREDHPMIHHALMHCYTMLGDAEAGIKYISQFAKGWQNGNVVIESHNPWHLAVLRIMAGQHEGAMALYDNVIWVEHKKSLVVTQCDAVSLLWRADLMGLNLGDRWQDVADYAKKNRADCVVPFDSMHTIYALARARLNDAVAQMLEITAHYASLQHGMAQEVWQTNGLPVLQATAAFAREAYDSVCQLLQPIIYHTAFCIGGSDAQMDVLMQTYLASLIKTKQYQMAKHFFTYRLRTRDTRSPLDKHWLEKIEAIPR